MKLTTEINRAVRNSLMGKYLLYVFQILSLAILSRLFTPEMFGVIATFQVFILFFQMLANSSLTSSIVYHDVLTKEQRDGIFTFTLSVGILFSLFFFLLTPFISSWLNLNEYNFLSFVLAFNVFFSALSMLPIASLQKDIKFGSIAWCEIGAEITSLAVCALFYFWNYGVEALALKLVIVPIARFIGYYYLCAETSIGRPTFGKKITAITLLYSMAKYQMAFNILNFFSRNLDTLLISKYFGVTVTGVYEKSYQIMRYPLQLFTFAITPALHPVFTKHKDKPKLVEIEYYKIITKLVFFGFFASTVLFWCSEEAVFILFGPQWNETANILKVLSVTVTLQVVLSSTGGVFQAFGATREMFKCGLFSSVVNVAAIVTGILYGDVIILCILLSGSFLISYFQCFYILHKNVFNSTKYMHFFMLSFVVLMPYINLFFYDSSKKNFTDYKVAIFDISLFSLFVATCLILFFILTKKHITTYFKTA
ncbi:lipopolysaccharide biosynthesis protein [Endozoicomonas sp. 2B-B]